MSDAYVPRHARPSRLRAVLGGLAQAVIALTVIALAAWFLNMPHGALPAGPYMPASTPASVPGQHAGQHDARSAPAASAPGAPRYVVVIIVPRGASLSYIATSHVRQRSSRVGPI